MGASIDYLATLLGLFKTLFDSPQLMITTTIENQDMNKSEKGDLIRSLSSVYDLTVLRLDKGSGDNNESLAKFRTLISKTQKHVPNGSFKNIQKATETKFVKRASLKTSSLHNI